MLIANPIYDVVFKKMMENELKIITDILHYTVTDPQEKKKIETEEEAWRTIEAMTGNLRKKAETLIKELTEKEKELTEKDKELTEKDRLIEELKRKLGQT